MTHQARELTIIEFPERSICLLRDDALGNYGACFHGPTGAILHGGQVELEPSGDLRYGLRRIPRTPDHAEFIAHFAAECEKWAVLPASDPLGEELRALVKEAKPSAKHRTVKVRIKEGTGFYEIPDGPWSADAQGIYDRNGNVSYVRSGELPQVAEATEQGADSLIDRIRGLFGRR